MYKKTNAIRILEKNDIYFKIHYLEKAEGLSGVELAGKLFEPIDKVYKTLVTVAKSKINYVFVIPVEKELDLKKAAKVVGEKSVEMLKSKELLPLTGYVHGGCSPIGMKKSFKTIIDVSAESLSNMYVSGGMIGLQVELNPSDLKKVVDFEYGDITL